MGQPFFDNCYPAVDLPARLMPNDEGTMTNQHPNPNDQWLRMAFWHSPFVILGLPQMATRFLAMRHSHNKS